MAAFAAAALALAVAGVVPALVAFAQVPVVGVAVVGAVAAGAARAAAGVAHCFAAPHFDKFVYVLHPLFSTGSGAQGFVPVYCYLLASIAFYFFAPIGLARFFRKHYPACRCTH